MCKTSSFLLALSLFLTVSSPAQETNSSWLSKELARFKAPEAKQGVAVDEKFFYAINNREIVKYRKTDGSKVAQWKDVDGGRFIHINAGIVKKGKLYGAHSNFPKLPMVSSMEIWDTKKLQPIGNHNFGETDGSLTWVDQHEGHWYAGFVHYAKKGGVPGRGPEWSRVVKYDDQWKPLKTWTFPADLIERFAGMSSSGAAFGPKGYLYVTGHDAKELYVLEIPTEGSVLKWIATVPVGFEGQAFSWDPTKEGVLYSISRAKAEVVVTEILPPTSPAATR